MGTRETVMLKEAVFVIIASISNNLTNNAKVHEDRCIDVCYITLLYT